ncbi:hypothetical protein TM49_00350 [Martelella endophytica]|uniref:Uncharacterized protein n=1 Tax=Martelella endophytica TaxID=1486262 RepID=A0A0D5LME4_MAREN|nr:hypothetical protein TM49_00350 [Martelella endophytica]
MVYEVYVLPLVFGVGRHFHFNVEILACRCIVRFCPTAAAIGFAWVAGRRRIIEGIDVTVIGGVRGAHSFVVLRAPDVMRGRAWLCGLGFKPDRRAVTEILLKCGSIGRAGPFGIASILRFQVAKYHAGIPLGT